MFQVYPTNQIPYHYLSIVCHFYEQLALSETIEPCQATTYFDKRYQWRQSEYFLAFHFLTKAIALGLVFLISYYTNQTNHK